jgi:hypothetical protein
VGRAHNQTSFVSIWLVCAVACGDTDASKSTMTASVDPMRDAGAVGEHHAAGSSGQPERTGASAGQAGANASQAGANTSAETGNPTPAAAAAGESGGSAAGVSGALSVPCHELPLGCDTAQPQRLRAQIWQACRREAGLNESYCSPIYYQVDAAGCAGQYEYTPIGSDFARRFAACVIERTSQYRWPCNAGQRTYYYESCTIL